MYGVGGGRFAPDEPVTREQLAAMLHRYAMYMGYDVPAGEEAKILSYNDAAEISEYAFAALRWACGAGIFSGDGAGNLAPGGHASRAHAAAALRRFLETVADSAPA